MDQRFVIGIDIGTSGCKCAAVSRDGGVLMTASENYPVCRPAAGWSEQSPEDWWIAALHCLQKLSAALDARLARAISFSGQMHGLVALDAQNRVVRPAILWNDQRTGAQCEQIIAAAGGVEGLLSYTNNTMLTGYTGGKLLWMKQNEPENYERTVAVVNPKDYVRYRLTGVLGTEVSDASGTGLFDTKNRRWATALIERIGLAPGLFLEATESTALVGGISAEAAAQCGFPAGLPVYAGGGDAVISTVGMGLLKTSRVGVTLGTSGVVAMCLPAYADNSGATLQSFCNNLPNSWHAFGCTLSAAGSFDWLCGQFQEAAGGRSIYAVMDGEAAAVPPGAEGLLFLPYLSGERCPVFDENAAGAFTGLRLQHGRGHLARAVMEGVGYSLKQVFGYVTASVAPESLSCIVAAGGGVKSVLWRQILADIFELPVRTVTGSAEGGAFAAALLAGLASGFFESVEAAMAVVRTETETLPNSAAFSVYRKGYTRYAKLYGALKQIEQ